ncbi:DUF2924 domain-containing protein [Sphingomonas bacterium]|uniref:DUF2924 domain-containing protein n=1 Tax=Sphingomonas bacterium TaxID=1895847 RepID=UPI00262659D1|nr:DUF2924 domain-containing protein [Sphingomonas bacterium]
MNARLAAVSMMTPAQLKDEWQGVTKTPCPRLSRKLLSLALAWEIQAKAFGGLSRQTQQKLAQLADGKTRTTSVSAGMQFAREWQGKVYVVTTGDDNVVRWNDRDYRSLSEVARAITGTRWSGPAFFGLKRKLAA